MGLHIELDPCLQSLVSSTAADFAVPEEHEPFRAPAVRLPQSFPFRFVDTIVAVTAEGLEASFHPGTFPSAFRGTDWLPGELIIEGAAQATILLFERLVKPLGADDIPLLGSVDVRINRLCGWDGLLTYQIAALRFLSTMGLFSVKVLDAAGVVATGAITVAKGKRSATDPGGGERVGI